MSEGAHMPWKIQKIDTHRGPPAHYRSLYKRLPPPPKGLEWECDEETRHWMLVPKKMNSPLPETQAPVGTSTTAIVGTRPLVCPIVTKHDFEKASPRKKHMVMSDSKSSGPSDCSNEESCEGIEGIDYVVHTVLPTDTLCGICLSYRVKATTLRQINKFSGSTLLISSKLVIPLQRNELGKIRLQDHDSPEYKIHSFQAEYPALIREEARAYLELSEWDLDNAIVSAKEDVEWERSQQSPQSPRTNATITKHPDLETARQSPIHASNQITCDRFRSVPLGELEKRRPVGTSKTTTVGTQTLVCPRVTKHDCKNVSPKQKLVMGDFKNPDPCGGSNEEAVEDIDYVVHTVLPTDTLCGICLSYRVKATTLRQVNKFSGSTLLISSKLVIPLKRNELGKIRLQDRDCPEYKIHSFRAEYPALSSSEARAYLELSDWNLDDAIASAKEDIEWEGALQSPLYPPITKCEQLNPSGATINAHVAAPARRSPIHRRNLKRWDRFRCVPPGELEMRSL